MYSSASELEQDWRDLFNGQIPNVAGLPVSWGIPSDFSVDPFLDRTQTKAYNCLDFVREVWLAMTGCDITKKLTGLVGAFAARKATVSGVRGFKRLPGPKSPCFVVMQRALFVPHIGIYMNGRILHLTKQGVQFQPLIVARNYFISVKYYE